MSNAENLNSLDNRRTERFNLRVTAEQAAHIRHAAEAKHQTVTKFLVEAAIQDADRALAEDRKLVLINEVFDRLAEQLDESDEPIQALAELIKRPRRVALPE